MKRVFAYAGNKDDGYIVRNLLKMSELIFLMKLMSNGMHRSRKQKKPFRNTERIAIWMSDCMGAGWDWDYYL